MAGNLRGLRDSANGFDLLRGKFVLPLLLGGEARGGGFLLGFCAGFCGDAILFRALGSLLLSSLGVSFCGGALLIVSSLRALL
ncbi:MAG: hypothetical protein EBY09_12520, partial [Verrucomicrobia bacterium]|nr:hypothetical protein [Verrucomicrobiota bacterium]